MRWKWAPPVTGALAFWLVVSFSGTAWSEVEVKAWKGGATPPLRLHDLDGGTADLAALRGRIVLINFWATWCEPCREEMPSLERLRDKLKGRRFELLTVNYGESKATVSRFLARHRLSVPVLLDPEKKAADEWKVRGLPMTFLVDAGGRIRFWTFGEQDWSQGEAFGLVERLVAEAASAQR